MHVVSPLVICGPSGVGKGTIVKALRGRYPSLFGFSVSHTTRKPRPGEEDGVHYHFVSEETMREDIAADKFLEYASVHGNYYGTSLDEVLEVQRQNKVCILEVDVQGVEQIKASRMGPMTKYVFVAPPDMVELEHRLRNRGTESEEKVQLRLKNATMEMAYSDRSGFWDMKLVNDDCEQATDRLASQLLEWYPNLVPQ